MLLVKKLKDSKPFIGIERVRILLEGVDNIAKNIDKFGMFATGFYAARDLGLPFKFLGGVKALVGYQIAKSPNIFASGSGMAWTAATLTAATRKALDIQKEHPFGSK